MGRRPAAPAENCPKRIGQTTGTGLGHWNLGLPVLLATVLLGTPLLAASPAEAADGWRNGLPPPGRLDYVVTRGGTDIGRNTVEFLRDGDGLVVRTRMDIEVDFMSITLYRLHHKGEEHWKDGRLFAYTSRTDDDGTDREIELVAENGRLKGRYNGKAMDLPGDLILASLWHPATVSATVLLDPIRCRERQVQVVDRGTERIDTPAGRIEARHYSMTGQIKRDLWYDQDGKLVLVKFPAKDGTEITVTLK